MNVLQRQLLGKSARSILKACGSSETDPCISKLKEALVELEAMKDEGDAMEVEVEFSKTEEEEDMTRQVSVPIEMPLKKARKASVREDPEKEKALASSVGVETVKAETILAADLGYFPPVQPSLRLVNMLSVDSSADSAGVGEQPQDARVTIP